jgi:hypothetical protein
LAPEWQDIFSPGPKPFLALYVPKEAVLSFQNEMAEISISDLQLYENVEMPGAIGVKAGCKSQTSRQHFHPPPP